MIQELNRILQAIIHGQLQSIYTVDTMVMIQREAVRLIDNKYWDNNDLTIAQLILNICNIIYNNSDAMCPLEDGVYDRLLDVYKIYDKDFQVGAEVVNGINNSGRVAPDSGVHGDIYCPIIFADPSVKDGLFYNNLSATPPIDPAIYEQDIDRTVYPKNNRDNLIVPHKYPKLVGTLDKCKFVLMKEAIEAGVAEDPTIVVFERDFLGKQLMQGIINPYQEITLLLELKYDGMSVEADVCDHIISARSRGDTAQDLADDLTPVLAGYKFPYCKPIPENESFGMKFEAIITKHNLEKLARLKGRPYKNGRNGIVGLMKSIDAYAYRDLITLVPLETSLDIDPITEVEFMNTYYHSGEYLRYAVVKGNYNQVLFQVYRFVKEAEAIRDIMPFMYDGVVVHHIDPNIRRILGRENSVNKYSIAIKFTPKVKDAIFTGYSYTVGQNGTITPMIHYTPVEFYGTIHTKSSGHSFQRFKELDLSIGEMINVSYRNDVMPYVTKPVAANNQFIPTGNKEQFPMYCPCCGTPLEFTERSARCPNVKCSDRVIARLTNMLDKLDFKDFSEAALRSLNVTSFTDFLNIDFDRAKECLNSELLATKLMDRLNQLKTQPIFDYKIIGSLGFTDIAIETWKKILNVIHINDIINLSVADLYNRLINIRGIGQATTNVIIVERRDFLEDLQTITRMGNVICTFHLDKPKTIRFSGVRDKDLEQQLQSMGYDANGNASVTKSTNILLIPEVGYMSEKMKKAGDNTQVIQIDEFKKHMDYYLSLI